MVNTQSIISIVVVVVVVDDDGGGGVCVCFGGSARHAV